MKAVYFNLLQVLSFFYLLKAKINSFNLCLRFSNNSF